MALETTKPIKLWNVGVIISRSFDNPDFLDDTLLPHRESIGHIYSNAPAPGGLILEAFVREQGIPYTLFPTTEHTFVSVRRVLESSDFVYVISDGESKIAKKAEEECVLRKIRHKVLTYSPFIHWRDQVGKIGEILSAIPTEEIEANPALKAIRRVLK
jgi:hypothetical protein